MTRSADGYAELRTYAGIGDGRTVALVAQDGRIDWLPLPDLDSSPVFAALLDAESGGYLALAPVAKYEVSREYVPHTNVLATTFRTATGVVRVTDSLNTGVAGRLPWAELARRIDGVSGSVRLRGEVRPGTRLNSASPWVHQTKEGAVLRVGRLSLAVRTLHALRVDEGEQQVTVEFESGPGSRHLLGLVAGEGEPLFLPRPEDIDDGVDRTIRNWQAWSDVFDYQGAWPDAVRRSTLALKLLIYAPTGAMAAAATTSLPESRAGAKNWDYRYAWVRDMAYSLTALFRFGLREEVHGAIRWMLGTIRQHGAEPLPFYQLNGDVPGGRSKPDVPGWHRIGPVVNGNAAVEQLQLGVFGDLFSIVRLYVDNGNVLDPETGRMLAGVADLACDRWIAPDAGMWELAEQRHYVTSKLGCWQALVNAIHLAEIGQIPGDADRWRAEAQRIRDWVDRHGWSEERQAYIWYPGSSELDASILLHAISGFDTGPRMLKTIEALQAELGDGPHLYRYSGMQAEEGSFVACSFWLVSGLYLVGRQDEARALMERLLEAGNDVGLYPEMIDPADGSYLGNLPQALSHLALINAAITVSTGAAPYQAP